MLTSKSETQNYNPSKVFGTPEFKNNMMLYICFYKLRQPVSVLSNDKVGTFL